MAENNDWPEKLKNIKAKSTGPRLRILMILEFIKKPIGAKIIINRTKLDKSTVYRVLKFFEKENIVRLIDLRQGERLYEVFDAQHKHHIICIGCGSIKPINLCLFSSFNSQVLKDSGFAKISDHSMKFFSYCQNCYKKIIIIKS